MERHSSGAKSLEILTEDRGWVPLESAYLREATNYSWRCQAPAVVIFQGTPLPYTKEGDMITGVLITPFQSGEVTFEINNTPLSSYVYTDTRKLTETQYEIMLDEILQEAQVCFQYAGAGSNVDTSGVSREMSWTQWNYIQRSFRQLALLFQNIAARPFRKLENEAMMLRREKIKSVTPRTLHWLDKSGAGSEIPPYIRSTTRHETFDVYENKVMKKHLTDLRMLLSRYAFSQYEEMKEEAQHYLDRVTKWLNHSFLASIPVLNGPINISQKFRKHPDYRLWYQWFEKLYQHQDHTIGMEYSVPLKDTYELYEMWCYMRLVKLFREKGLLEDTRDLYKTKADGIFLSLAVNHESCVRLKSSSKLYYQRIYQYNSPTFYTYTQRMIPDIVLESEDGLIIFDPKYRVPGNIGTALGEMHKYRDGILKRGTNEKAVKEVYILTPVQPTEDTRYYEQAFHDVFGMGALPMVPGIEAESVVEEFEKRMEKEIVVGNWK